MRVYANVLPKSQTLTACLSPNLFSRPFSEPKGNVILRVRMYAFYQTFFSFSLFFSLLI